MTQPLGLPPVYVLGVGAPTTLSLSYIAVPWKPRGLDIDMLFCRGLCHSVDSGAWGKDTFGSGTKLLVTPGELNFYFLRVAGPDVDLSYIRLCKMGVTLIPMDLLLI